MIRIILAMLTVVIFSHPTRAHQAPSGMVYPPECCSGHDCALMTKIEILPDGSRRVTNANGHTAIFAKDHPIRRPDDGQNHACIGPVSLTPYCLFLAPGV